MAKPALITLTVVGNLHRLEKSKKSKMNNLLVCHKRRCSTVIPLSAWERRDIDSETAHKGWSVVVSSAMKASGLYTPKRGSNEKTCFVAKRPNLIPLYILTQAGEGLESAVFKSLFLSNCLPQTSCSVQRDGRTFIQK